MWCIVILCTVPIAPGISEKVGMAIWPVIELGMCIGACIALGEVYDLAMLCGVEYDECSDMWGETERSMLDSCFMRER